MSRFGSNTGLTIHVEDGALKADPWSKKFVPKGRLPAAVVLLEILRFAQDDNVKKLLRFARNDTVGEI